MIPIIISLIYMLGKSLRDNNHESFIEYIRITRPYIGTEDHNSYIDTEDDGFNLPDEYGIQEIYHNKDDAANILAVLHEKMVKYANELHNKYPNDERTLRLWERINMIKIEEAPQEPDTSSYTLNKSELMALCLRPKYGEMNNKYNFHDMDTLWFVVAHEMAHVMSISEGHNKEFLTNFKYILRTSNELGFYHNPANYNKIPITYCGVKVTNNPYFNS